MSDERKADALDDLRSTSDAVLDNIDGLRQVEEERAELDADDPRRGTLAERASEYARELRDTTRAETDLVREVTRD